jgi:hypothetical protein
VSPWVWDVELNQAAASQRRCASGPCVGAAATVPTPADGSSAAEIEWHCDGGEASDDKLTISASGHELWVNCGWVNCGCGGGSTGDFFRVEATVPSVFTKSG